MWGRQVSVLGIFNSQLNTSGREPGTCDTPVSHSIDKPTRNEWRTFVTQSWLASAVATGLLYRGNHVVGAVGEMASMKWRKLWQMGENGPCCSSSAIQTQPGHLSLLEERSVTPIVFVGSYHPKWGKQPRYIDRIDWRDFFLISRLEVRLLLYVVSSGTVYCSGTLSSVLW